MSKIKTQDVLHRRTKPETLNGVVLTGLQVFGDFFDMLAHFLFAQGCILGLESAYNGPVGRNEVFYVIFDLESVLPELGQALGDHTIELHQ